MRPVSMHFFASKVSRLLRDVVPFAFALVTGCASTPATTPPVTNLFSSHQIDFDSCSIFERTSAAHQQDQAIRFVFIGGVGGPGKIFEPLATQLSKRLDATVVVLDLPGMGQSRLHGIPYTWSNQRTCLDAYLQSQPPFFLVVHDIAGPIVLPLLAQLKQLRGVVILNTIFDTEHLHPPFPMNWIRNAGPLGKPLAYTMNFPFYQMRVRRLGIARDEQVSGAFLRSVYDEIIADSGKGRLAEVMQGFELGAGTDRAIRDGLAVNVPQLFIWGEADPVLGKEIDKLPPGRSNQHQQRLPGAKHFFMMDHVAEITVAIDAWLREEVEMP